MSFSTDSYTLSLHDALPIFGLGLLIANLGGKWTTNSIPFENRGYLPNYGRITVDTTMVLYAIAVAVLSVLLFSISPVLEGYRSEEHTSELQSLRHLVCRLLL